MYQSKTNQQGIGDYDGQAKVISLPNIKSIIDNYEIYFVKHPVTKLNLVANGTIGMQSGKKIKSIFQVISEFTDIKFGDYSIPNYLGRKTVVQVLKKLGYSDAVVMSIIRHKSQKGLAAYKQPKTVIELEGLNGFLRVLTIVNNKEGQFKAQPYISRNFKWASLLISTVDVDEIQGASNIDNN
ncbi:1638_t:CDS:2 [Gigaspora rosea]|nr:1638_t:CDS:2 [Gigaspora rosea]